MAVGGEDQKTFTVMVLGQIRLARKRTPEQVEEQK